VLYALLFYTLLLYALLLYALLKFGVLLKAPLIYIYGAEDCFMQNLLGFPAVPRLLHKTPLPEAAWVCRQSGRESQHPSVT
jgi:hypothetical protein